MGSAAAFHAALILLTLVGIAGCSTTVSTKKLTKDTSVAGDALHGVPFTLNKPRYTIVRTPAGPNQVELYSINVEYVPDPTQRYTVTIDPTWFASTDFSITFDENGSIADVTAKTINQAGPVLAAVGKVVAGVVAVAGVAVFSSFRVGSAPPLTDECAQIHKARRDLLVNDDEITGLIYLLALEVEDRTSLNERARRLTRGGDSVTRPPLDAEITTAGALCRRLNEFLTPEDVRKDFFYQDSVELAWLQRAASRKHPRIPEKTQAAKKARDALELYTDNPRDKSAEAEAKSFAVLIDAYESSNNVASLKALRARVLASRERIFLKRSKFDDFPSREDLARSRLTLRAITTALKALPVGVQLAHDLAEMPVATWLARYDARKAEEIEKATQKNRLPQGNHPDSAARRDEAKRNLLALRRERAEALGVATEHAAISKLLEKIGLPETDEHKHRDLDRVAFLQKRIDDAESAAKALPAKEVKPEEPVFAIPVKQSSCEEAEKNDEKKQIDCILRKLGDKRPKYVIFTIVNDQ